MYGESRALYPMLGMGTFFAMFWVGVVAGYELGASCLGLLGMGIAFACFGAWLVARMEAREYVERAALSAPPPEPADAGRAAANPEPTWCTETAGRLVWRARPQPVPR